jgi:hypothetical protein
MSVTAVKVLLHAYESTPVGNETWLLPYGKSVDEFQLVVAIAKAWVEMGIIEILETRDDDHSGRRLIDGVRFRRLR